MKNIKFKELLLKNLALKILSVVIAAIVWLIIINVDNPKQARTISGIQVNLLNEDALIGKNYTYAVQSGSVISIVVKAPQTIVDNLDASDFYATADLKDYAEDSELQGVKIKVKCIKEGVSEQVDITELKTEYVNLFVDTRTSKEFNFTVEYTGEPAEGYVVGDVYTSPTTIAVSGAKTTIDKIASVKVKYDITNMTQSVSEDVTPIFYDENGKVIKTDLLEMSRENVKLNIDILPTKWIPVNYSVSGNVADGYVVVDTEVSLTSVKIAASKENLDLISSITIPGETINIEGIKEDKVCEVDLSSYLSGVYKIVSDSKLKVTFDVQKKGLINVPYNMVRLEGTRSGYEYTIVPTGNTNSFIVSVTGEEDAVNALTALKLDATVNMAGKLEGEYEVKVTFADENGFTFDDVYYLTIRVEEERPETEAPTIPEDSETSSPEDETLDEIEQ